MGRAEVLNSLPVGPSDFVVEIGAGPVPFHRTRLIVDKYPFDNLERHGDIVNLAPVIQADATKLPIADRGCDVLFVSHVIEHMPRPDLFIEEAKRCARDVYLEFPSLRRELMYAWSFHRWLVTHEDGRLVFYRHDIPQVFGDFFHANYDFPLDLWSEHRFEQLNTHVYCRSGELECEISPKGALQYVLERSASGEARVNFASRYGERGTGNVAYPFAARLKTAAWSLLPGSVLEARNRRRQRSNRRSQQPLSDEIVERLRCQNCRNDQGRLRRSAGALVCSSCDARYLEREGVFDFDV
jgi:SAM-dependent methyltransferase